jgi:glycosyltransferase involved in cell wall biosynthesis
MDAQVDLMSRRLLALAWMMPPLIFPRSLQISRSLRAMADRGWNSTVIAVPPDNEPFAAQDPNLEKFYRGSYQIHYVEPREEVQSSPLWLRIARRFSHQKNNRDANWIRRASVALAQEIEAEMPAALISFAQPWVNHLVALRVKRRYKQIPWVVHFSDPWVDSPYFTPANLKAKFTAIKQEKQIISAADAVIFTTQETADLVMAKYPVSWLRKVHILTHGYDADLLGLIKPQPKTDKFSIIHTGNLYEKREPLAFLRALATLRIEKPAARLHVRFVGYATQVMQDMVKQLDLGDIVSLSPSVSFLDSLAIAQSADLLLVIDAPAEHSVFLPSKTVDYLSLRRPIAALTPPAGASARILGSLGFPVVDPMNEVGILAMLCSSIALWEKGEIATPLPQEDLLRAFDIRKVVVNFESIIMSIIKTRGQSNG